MGCVAMFLVFHTLAVSARSAARSLGDDVHRAYIRSGALLIFLWFLYPIAWGIADGGNVISTDSEMIFYGILDLLAKPVFTIFHLFSLRNIPYERFGFASGHASVGYGASAIQGIHDGAARPISTEKPAYEPNPGAGSVANPAVPAA